jgi:diketogulonate reductase-like aldo/keto reductase
VRSIAEKHGKSRAQIVLRWHLYRRFIVTPKSVIEQRVRENIDVFDFSVAEKEANAFNGLNSRPRTGGDPAAFDFLQI